MRFLANTFASYSGYSAEEAAIVSLRTAHEAYAEICTWPGYAPTPLRRLDDLAHELSVGEILYKDESSRFDQGSFKILGGAYAAELMLRSLPAGAKPTLCCATDGNHGRSVAYAAQKHGCPCVVFMHEQAPEAKAKAIAGLGAKVIRLPGNYDDSVRYARECAVRENWMLIADTSNDPDDVVTQRVMQGYGTIVLELLDQFDEIPSHIFLQAGVGGLAASVSGLLADKFGAERPRIVVVEPENAACLMESARLGAPSRVKGDLLTIMAMLSTGEASSAAWRVLRLRADAFLAIDDAVAIETVMRLRTPANRDVPLDVGYSGAAGLAGLVSILRQPELAERIGLSKTSRVLLLGTEGEDALKVAGPWEQSDRSSPENTQRIQTIE